MECNKDEAVRAKEIAESKMTNDDFEGGKKFALKAQKLFPEVENILQMLAVCDVHCSAKRKINGVVQDLYGILQVESSADEAVIRKQYRKLALVLHPDKNKFPGAEAAFKLVGEAHRILSDKEKRYLHDYSCREPGKGTILKAQNTQGHQSSQTGGQNAYSNGHQQQSRSDSNARRMFQTFCLFCKAKCELNLASVNKKVQCQICKKVFTAIDIGAYKSTQTPHPGHAGTQNVNPQTNMRPPQEGVAKKEKVKVDPHRAEPSFAHSACQPECTKTGDGKVGGSSKGKIKTPEKGNRKTKGGVSPNDISDSNGKNVECSKKSRKRSSASSSEEAKVDSSPEKKCRLKKSSNDVKDEQKEQKEDPADAKVEEEDDEFGSDSEDESEPELLDVPESEFGNFDKDKEEHCFAVDQIWAVYDTVDSMPRFYAQIRKVYTSGFRLRITWLEADPDDLLEKNWAESGLPVTCGRFKRGDSEETKDRLMFSHRIAFEKGSKRSSFVIYPKKGEVWALFKDWDITKWSSDPKNHTDYRFEIVEILSDFDKDNGVVVAYMVKVEGFVSLFKKTSRAQLTEHRVPSSDLFRFSHQIPSLKLTGNERADVPVGSYELDTASLPADLDQFYCSNNVKVKSENARSKGNLNQPTDVKNKATSSEDNSASCRDDDVNISSTKFTNGPQHTSPSDGKESRIVIHDFDLDRQNRIFKQGQVWVVGKSKDVHHRSYAQLKKIESAPYRLHVNILELCSDAVRPNSCGIYKASSDGGQVFHKDLFLYEVKAEVNGRNRFNIFPRKNEIWVLYKKQYAECLLLDVDAGNCDIVNVVENQGDVIKVLLLTHVSGYKSVFKGVHDKVGEIPIAESDRFFCQVPAVVLSDEQDGQFRGFWELDLAEFPGLVPS